MNMLQDDRLTIGGHSFTSRFILGSGNIRWSSSRLPSRRLGHKW